MSISAVVRKAEILRAATKARSIRPACVHDDDAELPRPFSIAVPVPPDPAPAATATGAHSSAPGRSDR
jgi:hypothetical protein